LHHTMPRRRAIAPRRRWPLDPETEVGLLELDPDGYDYGDPAPEEADVVCSLVWKPDYVLREEEIAWAQHRRGQFIAHERGIDPLDSACWDWDYYVWDTYYWTEPWLGYRDGWNDYWLDDLDESEALASLHDSYPQVFEEPTRSDIIVPVLGKPGALRHSRRRKDKHGKFDMRDYCVRWRGEKRHDREEADSMKGHRWGHIIPDADEDWGRSCRRRPPMVTSSTAAMTRPAPTTPTTSAWRSPSSGAASSSATGTGTSASGTWRPSSPTMRTGRSASATSTAGGNP